MALSLDVLSELYNRCNPDEPLAPEDPRNVDIDRTVDGHKGPRGTSWAESLARRVTLSGKKPAFVLFSGLRGSGKSTELNRLAGLLSKQGYLAVLTRAEDRIALHAPIDVPDLIMPLLYESEAALLAAEGADPEEAMGESAVRRIWNWLSRTDIELSRVEGGVDYGWDRDRKASVKFVADLKTRPSLRERVRKTVSTHLTAFLQETEREFRDLDARARKRFPRGIVVILDSLEKLHGMGAQEDEVLASAQRLFTSNAAYIQLPVHTLYTVPPSLLLRLNTKVEFIPMVKLHHPNGVPYEPGRAVLRAMIEQRIPAHRLNELLGPTNVRSCVDQLITASGGFPRALVELLQDLIHAADPDVTPSAFENVLRRAEDDVRRIVRFEGASIDWLASVAETRALLTDTPEEQAAAERMLERNVVLRYLNQDEWWELHPWVRAMPEIAAARERHRKAARAAAT